MDGKGLWCGRVPVDVDIALVLGYGEGVELGGEAWIEPPT